ncbi:MAG: hypothetical protein WBQ78_10435 [Gammaproteobacteria bacterium]
MLADAELFAAGLLSVAAGIKLTPDGIGHEVDAIQCRLPVSPHSRVCQWLEVVGCQRGRFIRHQDIEVGFADPEAKHIRRTVFVAGVGLHPDAMSPERVTPC